MTEYYEDEFLMADLIFGQSGRHSHSRDFHQDRFAEMRADIAVMAAITDRLRMQAIHIVGAMRRLKARDAGLLHPLERKYAGFEKLLCRQDLRQHWTLYRRAVRELFRMREHYARERELCAQAGDQDSWAKAA